MPFFIQLLATILEKIGLAWWHKHEDQKQQANRPLDNAEELSDLDNLPRH